MSQSHFFFGYSIGYYFTGSSSGLNQEVFDELQQGCTKMGAHLLNHYKVDGEKRRSDVNVREIEREFDLVRCAIEN